MVTHDQFLADVAAVYIRQDGNGSFGSGRLIAPDLVLTAGHVVDYQTREDSTRSGWKICLLRDRKEDGSWSDPAYEAEVIWRGSGELDLALLQVGGGNNLKPWLKPIFASYALHRPVGDVDAAGFPGAWAPREVPRDYSVRGSMRLASQHGPYAWDVAVADKPDDPHGWKGMSGSALCRIGEDDTAIIDFRLPQSRADLGITRTFESLTQKFRKEYLVSGSGPVPFGGRDSELARFDAWLFDPKAAPRMLVTAPAGRGKSALLVQWLKNLQDGGVCGPDGWQLAFMPISIRIGTNRPEVFYEGLARRLAEILGETLPTDAIRETSGFRYAVHNLLDRIADAAKQRVLVVIDGLDEALEGTFDADVFPKILPMNIRVVLSARWQFGDHDSRGWLERLRWDRGAPVETFELDRLDTKGIADVLVKLGAPLDVAAKDRDLVDRLAELTEGEPLLIRYYAEDLWLQSSTMTRVTRADLDDLKPGFDSYFKRWFELQEKQWNEEHPNLDRQRVDAALSVLAFALGPLRESDFLALMRRIHGVEGLIAVDRLLGPLRRFVFGSGKSDTGFTLSHPRIGEYLQRNRFAAHTSDLQHGFAEWGKAHLKDLNSGLIKPEKASAYLLQSLPEHLKLAKASPEDFMMMVEDGWRRAWEHLEGGHCGFASAVQAAWNALRQDGADPRLSAQWRCALTLSSIKSLGESVPNDLILAAVKTGVITVRQAAYFAQLKEPLDEGVKLLSDLARISHDNPPLAKELMFAAFAAAKVNAAEYLHSDTLAELALPLPPELLDEVIAAAKGLEDRTQRARAMIALAPYLTSTLLAEALAAATAIDNDEDRAEALAALAPHLPPDQKEEALRRSLDAAGAIRDDSDRAKALTTLASQLPAKQKEEALRLALASAATIGDEGRRAWRLAGLAPHLPPERREEALTGSLDAAKATNLHR